MAEPQLIELAGLGGLAAFFAAFALVALIIGLAFYVYYAFALMTIARKLNTEPAWLAWIPIANIYLQWKVSRTATWTIIVVAAGLILSWVPIVGQLLALVAAGVMLYWLWMIAELRKFPGWIVLLVLVPFLGQLWAVALPGVLAWMDRK